MELIPIHLTQDLVVPIILSKYTIFDRISAFLGGIGLLNALDIRKKPIISNIIPVVFIQSKLDPGIE
jgi:hypothetical protein